MYVTDTHPLIWYFTGKNSSLSPKVLSAFQKAENAEIVIYIPSVVFWEIALLGKRGRIVLKDGFENGRAKSCRKPVLPSHIWKPKSSPNRSATISTKTRSTRRLSLRQ